MPKRHCLDCRALIDRTRTRCPRCQATRTAPKRAADAKRYDSQWRAESARVRQAWVAAHGWVCPGWERDAHPSTDLVVDHDVGPLCRRCNSSKAGGYDKAKRRGVG